MYSQCTYSSMIHMVSPSEMNWTLHRNQASRMWPMVNTDHNIKVSFLIHPLIRKYGKGSSFHVRNLFNFEHEQVQLESRTFGTYEISNWKVGPIFYIIVQKTQYISPYVPPYLVHTPSGLIGT